jgi:hypothetical protein
MWILKPRYLLFHHPYAYHSHRHCHEKNNNLGIHTLSRYIFPYYITYIYSASPCSAALSFPFLVVSNVAALPQHFFSAPSSILSMFRVSFLSVGRFLSCLLLYNAFFFFYTLPQHKLHFFNCCMLYSNLVSFFLTELNFTRVLKQPPTIIKKKIYIHPIAEWVNVRHVTWLILTSRSLSPVFF